MLFALTIFTWSPDPSAKLLLIEENPDPFSTAYLPLRSNGSTLPEWVVAIRKAKKS